MEFLLLVLTFYFLFSIPSFITSFTAGRVKKLKKERKKLKKQIKKMERAAQKPPYLTVIEGGQNGYDRNKTVQGIWQK